MNTSNTVMTSSTSPYTTSAFWERLWRTGGLQSIGLIIVAYVIYGEAPNVGASPEALSAFYGAGHLRILIAVVCGGFATLNLVWFAAALRATLADAGQDGWGAAATASSAMVGGLFVLLLALIAGLAHSIVGSAAQLTSGLNDLVWAGIVLTSFPRAMLIMSGTFGFWRAGLISNTAFAVGVAAVVLSLLGGTTWMSEGLWAPDGIYSRLISPLIGLVWLVAASWVLLTRSPATRAKW